MSQLTKKQRKLTFFRSRVGHTVQEVFGNMIQQANATGLRVTTTSNGIQITVEPGMTVEQVLQAWDDALNEKHERYLRSYRSALSNRQHQQWEQDAQRRRVEIEALLKTDYMRVKPFQYLTYVKAVRYNEDPYGATIIRFARAWAVLMQKALSEGLEISEVEEDLSQYANYDNITGFQFETARAFLKRVWKYGDQLS